MKIFNILIIMFILLMGRAWADTAYIPPSGPQSTITRTANGNPIAVNRPLGGGVTYSGSVDTGFTIKTNRPHFGSAQKSPAPTATKTHPATFTGTYGEKARGPITTQTNLPPSSTLAKLGGTYMGGAAAGSVLNSPHAKTAAESLARGEYGQAAVAAAASFDIFGIGGGINGLKEAFQQAQQQKGDDFIAAAEAAKLAAEQQYDSSVKQVGVIFDKSGAVVKVTGRLDPNIYFNEGGTLYFFSSQATKYAGVGNEYFKMSANLFGGSGWRQNSPELYFRPPTMEELMLTQQEMQQIATDYLSQIMANGQMTNEVLKDLVNAMWASGHLNPNNTQTAVIGGTGANTFLSAPFTPAGSNQAQQTQFVVAPNGTVSTQIIPRPDLGAHTSQAPTRSPVGKVSKKPGVDIDIDIGGDDSASSPKPQEIEICDEDDEGKLVCLEAGSDDYEDLELSKNEVSLEFERKDYFDDGGRCPDDPTFNILGHTYTLTYRHVCRVADMVSPMMELLGIMTAAGIAYAAVREL